MDIASAPLLPLDITSTSALGEKTALQVANTPLIPSGRGLELESRLAAGEFGELSPLPVSYLQTGSGQSIADVLESPAITTEAGVDRITELSETGVWVGSKESDSLLGGDRSVTSGIVFIDGNVEDSQTLLSGVKAGLEVVRIDRTKDGIAQISQTLAGRKNLSSLHVVAHGDAGSLSLGSSANINSLDRYTADLRSWATALTEDADILLYSCNTAVGAIGQQFVQKLGELTGADIAASDDITGTQAQGGDWDLEYTAGTVSSPLAFELAVMKAYQSALATFTVTNTANTGLGSLENALQQANALAGQDTIAFNISTTDPGYKAATATMRAHWTIRPNYSGSQTAITDSVIIDATTQPGFAGAPVIELDGVNSVVRDGGGNFVDGINGLYILGQQANNSTIRGFVINNFGRSGIKIRDSNNNRIEGNYIGIDVSGTVAKGNGISYSFTEDHGICIAEGDDNIIGGTTAAQRNVVSGNDTSGIVIFPRTANQPTIGPSERNRIIGNYVGTTADGNGALGNKRYGIFIEGNDTIIGGLAAGERNVVSANGFIPGAPVDNGVEAIFFENGSSGNNASGNYIGIGADGVTPLGNNRDGIWLNGNNHAAVGNKVGYSGRFGVRIENGTGHLVRNNSIFSNGRFIFPPNNTSSPGLYFGNVGYFTFKPAPLILQTATFNGTNTIVTGVANPSSGGPNSTYHVEIYSNSTLDLGPHKVSEGETSLGFQNVSTNGGGEFTFTVAGDMTGKYITTAVTDAGNNNNALSPFSNAVGVGNAIVAFSNASYQINEDGTAAGVAVTLRRTGNISENSNVKVKFTNGTATSPSDFSSNPITVYFNSNESSVTAFLNTNPIVDDNLVELTENLTLTLDEPNVGTVIGPQNTATLAILDNDTSYTLAASSTSVAEGNSGASTAVTYTITRAGVTSAAGTIDFAIAGTAASGVDYNNVTVGGTGITRTGNTIAFAAGATTATITLSVLGDVTDEDDETIQVTLSNATQNNSTIAGTNPVVTTIVDDDLPPVISIANAAVTEGNSGTSIASFTVSLSEASSKAVSVNYATANGTATAGSDYTAIASTPIAFAAGETSKTISVTVNGDTAIEANETFNVNLSGAVNATIAGNGSGIGTINDDDGPTISIADVTLAAEGNSGTSVASFTVTLSETSPRPVTVNYATSDGTATAGSDYTAIASTLLTFAPGEISKTITVAVSGDTAYEVNETFNVNLSGAANGTIAKAIGVATVNNDDPIPTISIGDIALAEGNSGTSFASFTINLSNASSQAVTVNYATTNGTATAGSDYGAIASTLLTFAPGETSKIVTVAVNGDTAIELNETFNLNLSNAAGGTIAAKNFGTATINNDDGVPSISIGDITLAEGNSGTSVASFTVSLSEASNQAITVNYSTADGTAAAGSDYTAIASTQLVFAPGETSKTITVAVNGDTNSEPDETLNVNLFNPVNATLAKGTAVATIANDDNKPVPNTPGLFHAADFGGTNGVYLVGGTVGQSVPLQFNWNLRNGDFNNELGFFLLDDTGRVNGIAPGEPGFARAAISSQGRRVVFASGQGQGARLDVTLNAGDRLVFYTIQNNTTDNWLANNPQNNPNNGPVAFFSIGGGANPDSIDHARTQNIGTGSLQLNWEDHTGGGDSDFNDLAFQVGAVSGQGGTPPVGTAPVVPGTPGQSVPTTFTITARQGVFRNELGVFLTDDASGKIGNLSPGDSGYAAAAFANGNFTVVFPSSQTSGEITASLPSGRYLGWYLIQNNTTEQFRSQNPGNVRDGNPVAFFSFAAANPDGIEHMRQLPGGEFGFEDLLGGGDRDFDDLIFRFRFNV